MSNVTFTLTGAPLPQNFRGDPQQFFEAMLERMRVQTPFGITGLILNPVVLPSSDKGPVMYNRSWYVWNSATNQYEPVDIGPSTVTIVEYGASQPTDPDITVWIETSGIIVKNVWIKFSGIFHPLMATSGTTAARPTAPRDWQQYYDTDISCMIWWERALWRTVSGVRGDIKQVVWPIKADALTRNPGWAVLGESTLANNPAWAGRVISQAMKNADGSGALPPQAGIISRGPAEVFGVESVQLTSANVQHTHPHGFFRTGAGAEEIWTIWRDAADIPGPLTITPQSTIVLQGQDPRNTATKTLFNMITAGVSEFSGTVVENVQPTLALWTLIKE
jgi:hypothetical protein